MIRDKSDLLSRPNRNNSETGIHSTLKKNGQKMPNVLPNVGTIVNMPIFRAKNAQLRWAHIFTQNLGEIADLTVG